MGTYTQGRQETRTAAWLIEVDVHRTCTGSWGTRLVPFITRAYRKQSGGFLHSHSHIRGGKSHEVAESLIL